MSSSTDTTNFKNSETDKIENQGTRHWPILWWSFLQAIVLLDGEVNKDQESEEELEEPAFDLYILFFCHVNAKLIYWTYSGYRAKTIRPADGKKSNQVPKKRPQTQTSNVDNKPKT